MPRSDLTDITVVLDRSGSMQSIADETIGSYNQFLAAQRAVPGAATLSLVQFDHEYEPDHRAIPLAAAPPLTAETFVPRGYTSLLDAIGRTIVEAGARLAALPEADRPGRVVVVIVTDGEENHSREFSIGQIEEMIRHQREVYSWHFEFLGANQDAIRVAGTMGIQAANSLSFAATGRGVTASIGLVASKIGTLRSAGVARGYTAEDRERAMGK